MSDGVVTLVVNPAAGRGRAGRKLPAVTDALRVAMPGRVLNIVISNDYADARARALEAVDEAGPRDALVVMGGDGMTSIGLNACAGRTVPLGIIPAGTGNDFCRGAGIPTKAATAVQAIAGGWTRRIDLMKVRGDLGRDEPYRYVGSVVSTGFDEKVNWRTNHLPINIGAPSYLFGVLAELRAFKPLEYSLTIDGQRRELRGILVAVGNAGLFGGGMRICPHADVTDGQLDVTIIHPVSRGVLLRLLPTLFTGGFAQHPAAELLRARTVTVDGPGLRGMADGEPLGRPPLECTVVPGAVSLFTLRA